MEKILRTRPAGIEKARNGFTTWSLPIELEIGAISIFITKYKKRLTEQTEFLNWL